MSKAYMKKSHLHKPLKGQGSYDRSKEDAYDDLVAAGICDAGGRLEYEDILAELELASNQSVHRAITRADEQHRDLYEGEQQDG